MTEDDDTTTYKVVLNHEEQYSIWPDYRPVPAGWREEGVIGTKAECLSHIDQVWTDMRPLSLRRHLEEMEKNPPEPQEALPLDETPPLVERLQGQDHRAVVQVRVEDKLAYFRERIEIGHIHVLFPDTRGGTELGLALDETTQANALTALETGADVELCGELTLDDEHVICSVQLSTPALEGRGGLRRVSA